MDEGSPSESRSDSISSDTSCDPRDSPSSSVKDSQDNASNSDSDLPDIWASENESHMDDDVGNDLPSTSTGRVTASGCGKGHIKQEYTSSLAGKDGALDSESKFQAEEQPSGIGEKNSELDGDYNAGGQSRNQTHQNEISGDGSHANNSKDNGMTLGDLWKESQSYSQVEAVEYKFEDRPWDFHVADLSSPDAFQSRESPLPQVSPSTVKISSGVVRSSDGAGEAIETDAPSTSGTHLHHPGCGSDGSREDKINLAMTKSRIKPHCSDDSSSTYEEELRSWDKEQKRPDFDKQPDARRKLKVKRKKKFRDRRGLKKKQKVAKTGKCYSLADVGSLQEPESNQISTNEDCLQQGWGPVQYGKMDMLPPKNPTPMLNEGSEEEPVDTVSDKDIHKLRKCLVSTKAPAVSESETDSDETMIDSNDGDGHTESMTSDEVDEAVLNETTEHFDTQPFSPILHEESKDSLSDASEEFPTSETIIPRDFPPHLLEDKEHDDRKDADLEPKDLFQSDSHISCQSPNKEIHQTRRDDAGSEIPSSRRSLQRGDDSQGKYSPKNSQLSIKMENEDTKEQVNQQEKGTVSHGKEAQAAMSIPSEGVSKDVDKDSGKKLLPCQRNAWCPLELDPQERFLLLQEAQSAMFIPSKAHLSGGISEDLDKNSGKKLLPCLRNAWSPSRLHPQERLLLLQEGETEPVYFFSLEALAVPFSRSVAPSKSIAAPGKLVASRNEQHIQRPSRSDKLLSTTKQNDRQKEKNSTKRTNYVQDIPCTPSNPPNLTSKEPSETPFVSMIHSEQDSLQQPVSSNSNEMGLEDRLPADSRSLSHGHSSVLSESCPSTSSYSANISETIGGQGACSGTSATPNIKQDRAKPTGEDKSICPSDPPNPSLVQSDIRKPPEKRRYSQTSSHPADAVMPAGAILLPPVVDAGSRSSQELNNEGNAPMIVGEQYVPNDPRDISQRRSFQATQALCDGVEKIKPYGDDGIDNGGKKRVHLDTGTEDHGRAAKVPRSCEYVQDESTNMKSFDGSSHFPPSSRDSAQPRSILKKPDRNVASTSHGEDIGVVGHQVHRNLRSHSRSIKAPGISASSSSTRSPQRQRRKSSRLDASLDTEDGKSLQVSATGTSNDVRLSRQQKGKNKTSQQRKHLSSRKTESIAHGRRKRRQFGEATSAETSQRRNGSKGNKTGQNQSLDHQQRQSRSDQRPQRQSRQQKVSSEKQEHVRSEKRTSGEFTGAGTSQRRNGSKGNKTGQNQSLNHQQRQSRSDQRPQRQSRQQKVSSEKEEHVRSEKRTSGELTGAGTSQRRKGSKGNETGQNRSQDHQQRQSRSDQRPQRQSRQQKVSSEKQEHVRSEKRTYGEVTGAGTSQRRNCSKGNETGQNQSLDHQKRQGRSDQRPQRKSRQQKVSLEIQEHDNSERRSSGEVTVAGTSQRRRSKGNVTGQNQSRDHTQQQDRSDQRPQRKCRQQIESQERQEHDNSESRPSGELTTGPGTSQRRNGSNGNETVQNQSPDHHQQQVGPDQRPRRQSRQQQASSERQDHERSERRPSGEATSAGTSQSRNGSNGNEAGQNQSPDYHQQQVGPDQRLRRQSLHKQVSPERQEHDGSERRPSGELATGPGTSQRRNSSHGNETGQNQSPGSDQQPSSRSSLLKSCSIT